MRSSADLPALTSESIRILIFDLVVPSGHAGGVDASVIRPPDRSNRHGPTPPKIATFANDLGAHLIRVDSRIDGAIADLSIRL